MTRAERVRAPAPTVAPAALVQRCGGVTCPSGACDHDDRRPGTPGRAGATPGGAAAPHDFSSVAVVAPVRVTGADDPTEHEADRVADEVLRMRDPAATVDERAQPATIQLKPGCDDGRCDDDDVRLARSGAAGHDDADRDPRALSGGGAPLPASLRSYFEPRFGHDFSAVRIHTDERAARSARAFGALAYTFGRDVVFGAGRYQPGTPSGTRLLAHELTHVVQQGSATPLARDARAPAAPTPRVGRRATTRVQRDVSLEDASALDLRDSEPAEDEKRTVAAQRDAYARPAVRIAPAPAPVVQRACPPYEGYSAPKPIESYNCAGLAHRTYDYKGLAATQTALTAGTTTPCGTRCAVDRVKHWLWQYDMHFENSAGAVIARAGRDFHTVAGVATTSGDPTDVFSKNGKRPIYGPGTGPSFRPPARERATVNHPNETPFVDASGNPVYKIRTNYSEECFCLPCPSRDLPLQGPPPPPGPEPSNVFR
ncbi:MAG TPA: DUF4157 domain-containing protein [Actinomycetota bacterium]|nr:DUF4157 domain-containing protein [Actinomycetota bacterium]